MNFLEVKFEGESFLEFVRQEIAHLPSVNYELLRQTVLLLQMIARNSDVTKMSPQVSINLFYFILLILIIIKNLVICLAPNLLWDKEQLIYTNMTYMDRLSSLFSIIVMQHEFIFNVINIIFI